MLDWPTDLGGKQQVVIASETASCLTATANICVNQLCSSLLLFALCRPRLFLASQELH